MELRGERTAEEPRAMVIAPDMRRGGPIQSAIYAQILALMAPIEGLCLRVGLSADVATLLSLLTAALACLAGCFGSLALSGALYLVAGLFDLLDGRIARLSQTASPRGAALDSIVDRFAEGLVVSGLALSLRESPGLALCLVFLTASMGVSYARARGEGLGVKVDAGIMNRGPRVAILGLAMILEGLLSSQPPSFAFLASLGLLTFLTLVTALVRVVLVLRALPGPTHREKPKSPRAPGRRH